MRKTIGGICFALIVGAIIWAGGATASGLPSGEIPSGFGVSIHGASDKDLDDIADAGFRIVRMDMGWSHTEPAKGVYDWSIYDRMAAAMKKRGLRPLFILDYGNAAYSRPVSVNVHGHILIEPEAPITPAAVQAYAAWAALAARRFEQYQPIWEIWNEPENAKFWPPASNATQYAYLAQVACMTMRRFEPNATIIAPGAASPPKVGDIIAPPFLQTFLKSQGASCFDGVSVHPYLWVSQLPTTPMMWSRLREMLSVVPRVAGRPPPAPISSEWGLSMWNTSEAIQASYITRMYLLNAASRIPIDIWYDWRDDGVDRHNVEDNFGLTLADGQPKAALQHFRVMTHILGGYRFSCKIDTGFGGPVALAFSEVRNSIHMRIAVWTDGGAFPARWMVPGSPAGVSVFDPLGHSAPLGQDAAVALSVDPVFVDAPRGMSGVCN